MDILIRLRLVLWLMVICLWGLMIYQFLGDDEPDVPRMQWISKHFAPEEPLPSLEDEPRIPLEKLFPPRPEGEELTQITPGMGNTGKLARIPSSVRTPTQQLPRALTRRVQPVRRELLPVRPKPKKRARPQRKPKPQRKHKTPKGFVKTETRHFVIYSEGRKASLEFLETLESLHGNLMLDLAAFSPWARDERVSIYLFRTQDSYRRVTGRPAWSGGASSVKRRKIYIYESEELVGILAHELTHIYFDGFFVGHGGNPLWLSEGMATLVQTERGLAAPNWLAGNLAVLRRGGGYGLSDLMRVDETSNAGDSDIRLWYTQSYSVVRFLVRSQYRSSFYKFCVHLRDGASMKDALYRAYGMPFNRVKALEYAWRYDLQADKL